MDKYSGNIASEIVLTELFSLQDEQPDVQGLAILLSTERCATISPIGVLATVFI